MSLSPVTCSSQDLEVILGKISKKSIELLQVIDKIHDTIDGKQVIQIDSFLHILDANRKSDKNHLAHSVTDLVENRKRKISKESSVNRTPSKKSRTKSEAISTAKHLIKPHEDIKLKLNPQVVVSPEERKIADSIFERDDIPVKNFPDEEESSFCWSVHKVEDRIRDLNTVKSGKNKNKVKLSQKVNKEPSPFFRYLPKKLPKNEAAVKRKSQSVIAVSASPVLDRKHKPELCSEMIRKRGVSSNSPEIEPEKTEPKAKQIKLDEKRVERQTIERKGLKCPMEDETGKFVEERKKRRNVDGPEDKKEVQTDIRNFVVKTPEPPKKDESNANQVQTDIRSFVIEASESNCSRNEPAKKGLKRPVDCEESVQLQKKSRYDSTSSVTSVTIEESPVKSKPVTPKHGPRSVKSRESSADSNHTEAEVLQPSTKPSTRSVKNRKPSVNSDKASALSKPMSKPGTTSNQNKGKQKAKSNGNVIEKTESEETKLKIASKLPESFFRGNEGFCLDCDGCTDSCDHQNHPRILFRDLNIHQRIYKKHVRLQQVKTSSFF